jgi:hypothetical protein
MRRGGPGGPQVPLVRRSLFRFRPPARHVSHFYEGINLSHVDDRGYDWSTIWLLIGRKKLQSHDYRGFTCYSLTLSILNSSTRPNTPSTPQSRPVPPSIPQSRPNPPSVPETRPNSPSTPQSRPVPSTTATTSYTA